MSENPYQAPVPNTHTATSGYPPNRAPRALKVICILCVILGALGLLGSVLGIGSLLFQQQISDFQMEMSDPSQHEMQAQMAEAQASFVIPNMLIAICNLFVAPLLLVGGIGVLIKKRWGQKILSLALISATIFVLFRIAVTSFLQVKIFGIMKETVLDQIPSGPAQGGPGQETMETIIMASLYFGVALGVVMALSFAAFYFWGWRYLKKDTCQAYLSTFPE